MPTPIDPRSFARHALALARDVRACREARTPAPPPFQGPAELLARRAVREGTLACDGLFRPAVARLLGHGPSALAHGRLLSETELRALAEVLAATLASADLLGRALVRRQLARVLRRHRLAENVQPPNPTGAPLLAPEKALDYFRGLVPTPGGDPQRYGLEMRRRAFTLAVTTDREVLARVQGVIADQVAAGGGVRQGAAAVQEVLDAAGVSTRSPAYAEMVFRTNVQDALAQASWEEMRHPDCADTFPAWQYFNPHDDRSRPTHAERNGRLYAAAVPFVAVRGAGIKDAANCRCQPVPVDKWSLQDLLAGGAVLLRAA